MKALIAPISVDALVLKQSSVVKDGLADYTKLPYTDRVQDYNSDIPYIGEAILNHAFQDKNLTLGAGVHIHWSLPIGFTKTVGYPVLKLSDLEVLAPFFNLSDEEWITLCKQLRKKLLIDTNWVKTITTEKSSIFPLNVVNRQKFDQEINVLASTYDWTDATAESFVKELMTIMTKPIGSEYPAVPDFWLVQRKGGGRQDKTWIVESSYISETRTLEQGNLDAVAVPFHNDDRTNKTKPFRYLGRQFEVTQNVTPKLRKGNYLKELTAIGYNPEPNTNGFGEPTFAAFYPNSMSVFGCHDPEILEPMEGLSYEVVGMYRNIRCDYVVEMINDYSNRNQVDEHFFEDLNEILKNEFYWEVDSDEKIDATEHLPEQSILFGKTFPKSAKETDNVNIDIAIGNTGTEALSAFLNKEVGSTGTVLEDVLESIQMASKFNNKILDIGYKFQEARHEKGFTASDGGHLWSIKLEIADAQNASENADESDEITLPDDLALLLNEINLLQFEYDKVQKEIPELQKRVFSDWYKYMLSAYPPVDNLAYYFDLDRIIEYMRNDSLPLLRDRLEHQGANFVSFDESGRLLQAQNFDVNPSAGRSLTTKLTELLGRVTDFNTAQKAIDANATKELTIRRIAAPRYWQPNDPVILFAERPASLENALLLNSRYKNPGDATLTPCKLSNSFMDATQFSLADALETLKMARLIYSDITETGEENSPTIYNPFLLEWEVEYFATMLGKNDIPESQDYSSDYVLQNFELPEYSPEFELENHQTEEIASVYSGITILTPGSDYTMQTAINNFLADFGDDQTEAIKVSLNAAKDLLERTPVLSQSMGGFNQSLLMQHQTRQMDVADPLGFVEYQIFAEEEVAPLVQKMNLTSPLPLNAFNPIRSGELRILRLRIVDTFGLTVEINSPDNLIVSDTMINKIGDNPVLLKPRLSQPARINFRLLSAKSGEQEMNGHPSSSPICGWILPNNLDRSLMVYDQSGDAIGSLTINASNPWLPAPDGIKSGTIDTISNEHLKRLVYQLFGQQLDSIREHEGTSNKTFLHHFIEAMDNAAEFINPENFAEHQDLAVLMGTPFAVVRGSINLELEGPPATDQSWSHFDQELHGLGRSSDGFTKVKFPMRLGEHKQVNDGLVGYWLENGAGDLEPIYYSSEANENPDPNIVSYVEGGVPLNIHQAIDDAPVRVTMLVDPKGKLHVTTGVLPVKSIDIPKDQYKDALRNIGITFLTAPVLSSIDHLKISLPSESGYEWKWLERNASKGWDETPQTVIVKRDMFETQFVDQHSLWEDLIKRKWLQPLDEEQTKAYVTTAVHRAFPPSEDPEAHPFPIEIGKRLDAFFDTYGKRIEPFDFHVSFHGPMVIREGWLQLNLVESSGNENEN